MASELHMSRSRADEVAVADRDRGLVQELLVLRFAFDVKKDHGMAAARESERASGRERERRFLRREEVGWTRARGDLFCRFVDLLFFRAALR